MVKKDAAAWLKQTAPLPNFISLLQPPSPVNQSEFSKVDHVPTLKSPWLPAAKEIQIPYHVRQGPGETDLHQNVIIILFTG